MPIAKGKMVRALTVYLLSVSASYAQSVVVSCYRGPTTGIIWDHPLPIFVDSLVAVGYPIDVATSIAERICRDPELVDNPALAAARTKEFLNRIPPEK